MAFVLCHGFARYRDQTRVRGAVAHVTIVIIVFIDPRFGMRSFGLEISACSPSMGSMPGYISTVVRLAVSST